MTIIIWTLGTLATWALINHAMDGMDIVEEDMRNGHH